MIDQKEGVEKINLLHDLLKDVWLNYPDQAMEYGQLALAESERLNSKAMISQSLRYIAGVHYYRGDFETSQKFNEEALAMALEVGDSSMIGNGFNNIGLNYYNLGSYQTALDFLLRAKRIKEKTKDFSVMSTTLNNIGLVFERVHQYQEARQYFFQALSYGEQVEVESQIVYSKNNIAITYLREGNLGQARTFFNEALALAEQTNNINWGAVSLRGIGEIMSKLGQPDSATIYYHKSLTYCKQIDDRKGIAEVYYLLAELALSVQSHQIALECLDTSQAIAKDLKIRQQLLNNLRLYKKVYQSLGDTPNVIKYLEEYSNLSDSLYLDVVSRNLSLIPQKVKDEEDRLMLVQAQSELENTNQTYILVLLIITPLGVILVLLLIQNRKKNQILLATNEEIRRTQGLLISSEKMASLGMLSAGIGHEINNPLNFIKHGAISLEVQMRKEPGYEAKKFDPYFNAINEGVTRAAMIVSSLANFSKVGRQMDERCDIHEIIENCLLILNEKIRERIDVVKTFSAKNCVVMGNNGSLHQALLNV
ncbi:MAG: tetratricopeptide repeat protein, partial [Cyclobacteriaceae bacterium]